MEINNGGTCTEGFSHDYYTFFCLPLLWERYTHLQRKHSLPPFLNCLLTALLTFLAMTLESAHVYVRTCACNSVSRFLMLTNLTSKYGKVTRGREGQNSSPDAISGGHTTTQPTVWQTLGALKPERNIDKTAPAAPNGSISMKLIILSGYWCCLSALKNSNVWQQR